MYAALLMAIGAPIVKRVLTALGIGLITYKVSTGVLDLMLGAMQNHLSAMPVVVLQMVSLYGLPDFMGIIIGAHTTSLSLTVIKKFGFM